MSERVPSSGTVHWVGTGLSTGSGVRVVCDHAQQLLMWGRTTDKAERCLARLGLTGRASAHTFDPAALAAEVGSGDVVVSMLPAPQHPALLRMCIAQGAHFVCSSYVSDEITAEVPAARQAGTVVLTEAGLDPGIDHVLAHKLVAQAREALGGGPASAEFTSFCGGIPAVPNDFRYRFSWAPLGVLTALRNPARYIDGGSEKTSDLPWEATRPHTLDGEVFEIYPNRDSIPFVSQYHIPDEWRLATFMRGTIRLDGWRDAWSAVFDELRGGDANRIAALAQDLAARYPTTDADHDRVVLAVGLAVTADGGETWSGQYLLDMVGDSTETAMARCVSLPMAIGIIDILDTTTTPGLHRAVETVHDVDRWLKFLRTNGIDCVFNVPGRAEGASLTHG
jgi:Saccharopine dehydrogenase C-terminal domain/Saccharopine dehydrogenase NADP binding domain